MTYYFYILFFKILLARNLGSMLFKPQIQLYNQKDIDYFKDIFNDKLNYVINEYNLKYIKYEEDKYLIQNKIIELKNNFDLFIDSFF